MSLNDASQNSPCTLLQNGRPIASGRVNCNEHSERHLFIPETIHDLEALNVGKSFTIRNANGEFFAWAWGKCACEHPPHFHFREVPPGASISADV